MALVDVYECEKCGVGVEYVVQFQSEHNEFNECIGCFNKEDEDLIIDLGG